MATQNRPTSRKSIAYLPSLDLDFEHNEAREDKENASSEQADSAESSGNTSTTRWSARQKSNRSKSLGPGGLEALREAAGNKRKAPSAIPRSILKPTVPLSPLKDIPIRRANALDKPPMRSPRRNVPSSPLDPRPTGALASPARRAPQSPNKTPPARRQTSRDAEPDSAQLARQRQLDDVQAQRDARRKSLANRRVSFAPEATLHTFDNLEDLQDQTTSSATTDSTRRASSNTQNQLLGPSSSMDENMPSTPTQREEDTTPRASPFQQRQMHPKSQRVTSTPSPRATDNLENDLSFTSRDSGLSDSDEGEGQVDEIDESPLSHVSSTPSSPFKVDVDDEDDVAPSAYGRMLTPIPEQDGSDEDEGTAMDMVADEVTTAFQPWVRRQQATGPALHGSALVEVNPSGSPVPALGAAHSSTAAMSPAHSLNEDTDTSMDITRVIGGIIQSTSEGIISSKSKRKSLPRWRRSSAGISTPEDATMDLTTAVGTIKSNGADIDDDSEFDENEDLSMEFTNVVGGIRSKRQSLVAQGVGRLSQSDIIPSTPASIQSLGDDLVGPVSPRQTETVKLPTELVTLDQTDQVEASTGETDEGIATDNEPRQTPSPRRSLRTTPSRLSSNSLDLGSPRQRRASGRGRATNRKSVSGTSLTPVRLPQTPEKQVTPQPAARPTTPSKTPPPPHVAMRQPSPRKLFRAEIKQVRSNSSVRSPEPVLFDHDQARGTHTPRIRLAPDIDAARQTSMAGIDVAGRISPDADSVPPTNSLGNDDGALHTPEQISSRIIRFEEPLLENQDSANHEASGPVRESSGNTNNDLGSEEGGEDRDKTLTLKEAISGMSPKKNRLKGRKSLAIGGARGILGKRPLELDEDDDDSFVHTVLHGREASPVKKIRLQAPPTAFETTGRIGSFRPHLGPTSGNDRPVTPSRGSPKKRAGTAGTSSSQTRSPKGNQEFNTTSRLASEPRINASQAVTNDEIVPVRSDSKIGLQDFLDLTNIRFMELNTTKRRHTIVPKAQRDSPDGAPVQDPCQHLSDAVVAGACTLPMLELYQHSCRELKKYISEGRQVVREIEVSTAEENPKLFREYIAATPADRATMDDHFKHMKTHARHLSKGMWYEWRMKLLDGLRKGLAREAAGLQNDRAALEVQKVALDNKFPALLAEQEKLLAEEAQLQKVVQEMADCDQEELSDTRQLILAAEQQIEEKKLQVAQLRSDSRALENSLIQDESAKAECQKQIQNAKELSKTNRGWSEVQVMKVNDQVESLEKQHGWAITGSTGSRLTLRHRKQLELCMDVLHVPSKGGQPIELSYVGDRAKGQTRNTSLATEQQFFLGIMQARLREAEARVGVEAKRVLGFVGGAWALARASSAELERLCRRGITRCEIVTTNGGSGSAAERLAVITTLLVPPSRARVDVTFELSVDDDAAADDGNGGLAALRCSVDARAEMVYGAAAFRDAWRPDRARDLLASHLAGDGDSGGGGGGGGGGGVQGWAEAAAELERWLLGSGKI